MMKKQTRGIINFVYGYISACLTEAVGGTDSLLLVKKICATKSLVTQRLDKIYEVSFREKETQLHDYLASPRHGLQ